MFKVIRQVALTNAEFTADLPMEVYASDPSKPQTHSQRAMGPVVVRAMRAGIIRKKEGVFRNSNRRSCHNRPIQVYESLIYGSNEGEQLYG
jgi:hypothetical protein